VGWWSPVRRGVLPLEALVVSRSLRRACRRYEVRIDTAFDDVLMACADPSRDGAWINDEIRTAYNRLHELGWAHSVECWDQADTLVGGLYGIHIGGLFAGESMFHRATDASKVALVGLVEHLRSIGVVLLDVQWLTEHLATLGAVEISRTEYLHRLDNALHTPTAAFDKPGSGP
jgi:leucyl/phenylalanyl-tRNA--protein transferase